MNRIILTGRLTFKPELKTTKNGKSVSDFVIAVDHYAGGEKTAFFIRCQTWEKQAENLCRYKDKGDLIGVDGALIVEKYTNNDGQKREKYFVSCREIEYLGSRSATQTDNQAAFEPKPEESGTLYEGDLPF